MDCRRYISLDVGMPTVHVGLLAKRAMNLEGTAACTESPQLEQGGGNGGKQGPKLMPNRIIAFQKGERGNRLTQLN